MKTSVQIDYTLKKLPFYYQAKKKALMLIYNKECQFSFKHCLFPNSVLSKLFD
jgi:hypothetical protein